MKKSRLMPGPLFFLVTCTAAPACGGRSRSHTSESAPDCAVVTSDPGPYAVIFAFENPTDTPAAVAMSGACAGGYSITSCADGYRRPLVLAAPCGTVCPAIPRCSVGQCVDTPLAIYSDEPQTDRWDGYDHVERSAPVSCTEQRVAVASRYRITVPVYAPASSVSTAPPLYTVTVSFTLPAPAGIVHIPLGRPLTDAGTDS